ncbi:hypothetical protein [Streptomyces lasiicapitis]|uniref:hypothetical protein n=1 Tax=Streptomyces lasiicapitis TaxID=1923961 RepID=UPI003646FC53
MNVSRHALLRWQFELTWSLFEYHLERLEDDDHLWEPAARTWTLRRGDGGEWTPDWADTEPDPVPVPTVAHTAAWVNAELMKNAAEIGQLRLLRAASAA